MSALDFGVFILMLIFTECGSNLLYRTTCDDNKVDIRCSNTNEHLEILSASYGRTSYDMCGILSNTTNCTLDVLSSMSDICDGHGSCTMLVTESLFGDPCPGVNKALSYVYWCIEVTTTSDMTGSATPWTETTSQSTSIIPITATECNCACPADVNIDNYNIILSDPDLVQKLTINITKFLKLDRAILSSTIRRKTSVSDTRRSASYVGYVGIVVLVTAFSFLLVLDFTNVCVQRTGRSRRWRL